MTYLDASGEPLAAARFDGPGPGFGRDRVDGLPDLTAYPSLKGDPLT